MLRKAVLAIALLASLNILPAAAASTHGPGRHRLIHNNDGTDLLGNLWFGRRPLCKADLDSCVDLIAGAGVTTYMMCSGSDFAYYRSKYARVFGDDRGGALPNMGDTLMMNYYRNFRRLEDEGHDFMGAVLQRARERGMETFITYRMNDCHMTDATQPKSIYTSDFWMSHPECWMREGWRGWHADGALDFSHQIVREQKINMICEQLDLYGGLLDGYEMDFMRFPMYFKAGKGQENLELMTDLVRQVRAKVDAVSAALGHKILLTVRVPQVWESCLDNGLDVRTWVKEGLVDFITIGGYWRGDPAIDVKSFRKESGIGSRIPVYASIDDGSFYTREVYTHGMMRGASEYALTHGADGIYLFNFFLAEYNMGKFAPDAGGKTCRIRTPQLLSEMRSAKALEGLSKSYSYYSGKVEYGLHYKSTMPLKLSNDSPTEIVFDVADKLRSERPEHVYLIFRTDKVGSSSVCSLEFNGSPLTESDPQTAALYGRTLNILKGESVHCFEVPGKLLRHGQNSVSVKFSDAVASSATIGRMELVLDFGDPEIHGYN